MWTERFAPAKVNLFLHVGPVAGDGYHPVCSLMAFADVGDVVRLRDHPTMAFRLSGDFAGPLEAEADNLVVRARDRLIEALGGGSGPFEIVLEKNLPIAAGLGGGSSDAAATLLVVAARLAGGDLSQDGHDHAAAIARTLGADVTACLHARAVIGTGRGDDISPAPLMPPLDAVLVNPLAPSPTGAVYRAFDALPPGAGANAPVLPASFADSVAVIDLLRATRNDLEAPAIAMQPLIGDVLDALRSCPQAALSRMSGSGATCFALCRDQPSAADLAARMAAAHPGWWVRACRLT